MSFVGRRVTRRPLDDEDDSYLKANPKSGFRQRLSSLSPFASSSKRAPNLNGPPPPLPTTLPTLPTSPPLSEGINGYISKTSSSYASSQQSRSVRSASPVHVVDIHPPLPTHGMRRASAVAYQRSSPPPPIRESRHNHREFSLRPQAPIEATLSSSTPDLRNDGSPRWDQLSRSDATSDLSLPPPIDLSIIPLELLGDVFTHSSRHDLTCLARVCRSFISPAREALYGELDLRNVREGWRVEKCVTLMASRRDIAGFVRTFACRSVPGMKGGDPSNHLSTVTFAIALSNMSQLENLILPRFSAHLLFHTSFRLEQFTMLSEDLTEDECRDMLNWLVNQPSITSLSLPNLAMKSFVFFAAGSGTNTPDTNHASSDGSSIYSHQTSIYSQYSQQDLSNPSTFLISPGLLPQLSHFYGPVSLAAALVPGRPIRTVGLHIHHSLHDLLRPSSVIRALNRSEYQITRLALVASPKHRVDVRTFERILVSAGSEMGVFLDTIEVEWVLEDEVSLRSNSDLHMLNMLYLVPLQTYPDCTSPVPGIANIATP